MRTYSNRIIKAGGVIHPDDINAECTELARAFNKGIDAHNLPVWAITPSLLAERTYEAIGDAKASYGVFSDIYNQSAVSSDLTSAIFSTALRTGTTKQLWNSLADAGLDEASITLSELKPGILEGTISVDFERRAGYNGATKEGGKFWTRFGLFFDGELVAETGPIWPRRYTFTLPFLFPIAGGEHTLDIRWRARTGDMDPANSEYAQTLEIYGVLFNITNQKR